MSKRTLRAALAVFSIFLTTGCRSHVQLSAPPPTAPLPERMAAYERLRSTGYQQTHVTTVNRWGAATGTTRTTDFLQLASGERVYFPEDILPAVGPNSPSGIAALESQASRGAARAWSIVSIGALVAGLGVMLSSLAFISDEGDSDTAITLLLAGGGVAIVGSLLLIPVYVNNANAADEATTAYELYNSSLAGNLALCERDGSVVDCNAPAPPPAAVAPGPTAPPAPPAGSCVPECRSGYSCINGQCVSSCNPPCEPGTECRGEGATATCMPAGAPSPQQPPPQTTW